MNTKNHLPVIRMLLTSLVIGAAGCSSGGGGSSPAPAPAPSPPSPPPPSPTLQVLPATFDFGKVTSSNVPAPLEVTIKNNGTGALNVSGISFRAPADPNFMLMPSGGTKPCASVSPTVAPGDSCTVQVAFQPPANAGTFTSTLQITSNDATSPQFGLPISGTSEALASLTVRLNQVETACPANSAKAYVSVIDQGGYPVLGLMRPNFSLRQATTDFQQFTVAFVDAVPISISAVLDHSGSLTDQPVAFADMKTGFTNLFGALRTGDVGEVIKFDDVVTVVQSFTPDKVLLQNAVAAPYDNGRNTRLYDAVYQAIDEAAGRSGRKAVVVATDGQDEGPTVPYSTRTLQQVITNGASKNVPVFTIGLGANVNKTVLTQIAMGTGGLFYEANTSQNLATIYQQLTSLLYEKQYVLSFNQLVLGTGVVSSLAVGATSGTVSGSDTRSITSCN